MREKKWRIRKGGWNLNLWKLQTCVDVSAQCLSPLSKEKGIGLDYVYVPVSRSTFSPVAPVIEQAEESSMIPVPLCVFPVLERLFLCGVTSVPPSILSAFACSFPSLT